MGIGMGLEGDGENSKSTLKAQVYYVATTEIDVDYCPGYKVQSVMKHLHRPSTQLYLYT